MRTGDTRVRQVSDASRHIIFSPDLEWEMLLTEPVAGMWKMRSSGLRLIGHSALKLELIPEDARGHGQYDNQVGMFAAAQNEENVAPSPLPDIVLKGKGKSVHVCSFSERVTEVRIEYFFRQDDSSFFAVVTERTDTPSSGFEAVVLSTPEGEPLRLEGYRRVRAVAVDLRSGERSERMLPPSMSHFLDDPEAPRVICHSLASSPFRSGGRWLNWTCTILSLPGLDVEGDYRWSQGNGPVLHLRGWRSAFVGRDRVATMRWPSEIEVWRIGPEPPATMQ